MTQMSPALDAALRGPAPTVFGAISIDLPGYRLGLLDGAGTLTIGGRKYVGEDATYGVLSNIEELSDGTGDSAPAVGITLTPKGDAAAAALAAPDMQGAPVSIFLGAVNPTTGQVIDTMLLFVGELDVPLLKSGEEGRTVDYEVVSVFERLFEDDESARLSDGYHQSLFPGELGLTYVTGVDQPVFWGVASNPASISYGGYAGGYGGGLGSFNNVELY